LVTEIFRGRVPYFSSNLKENGMQLNVGTLDRSLRIVAGLALIGLAAFHVIGVWGYIGLVPLATGLFRFCPLYTVLGIRTCPVAPHG
jgi:Protein of unknown function (DUF2892)